MYLHRLRREIAAMNGLDVLVFTGGVGEHQPAVRAAAADGLAFRISPDANDRGSPDRSGRLSGRDFRPCRLVPTGHSGHARRAIPWGSDTRRQR